MNLGPIPFGVNLSFCVKRWPTAALWAPLVRDQLGLDLVQFSFDLIDPAWPDALLDDLAGETRAEAARCGVTVHSAFIGLAHYSYNQLLHPDPRVRDVAEAWWGRAFRFAASAGITRVGGPLGAIAARPDGVEADTLPDADYADLVARLRRILTAAHPAGLGTFYVEPTPLRREWPWTVEQAQRLADDLADAIVPVAFCVDWGHAVYAPRYGEAAQMETWLDGLGPQIGALHIQQTDGRLDRHWDFTEAGHVDPVEAAGLIRTAGLTDRPVFLEAFYPFERDDASVLDAMRRSIAILKPAFAGAAA